MITYSTIEPFSCKARPATNVRNAKPVLARPQQEAARRIILADLDVDPGSYDDHLEAVETGIGDITVAVENRYEPRYRSPQAANGSTEL